MLEYFYARLPSDCIYYKYVKIFGKYFKSPLTEEEKKEHRKKNTGVLYDVKNDKDASDVLIKLKKLTDKFSPIGSARIYYVPELNENESALICYGHHSLMDGFSVWQIVTLLTDEQDRGPYPFIDISTPPLWYWGICYMLFPLNMIHIIYNFNKYGFNYKQINCIKREPDYMTGDIQGSVSDIISLKKLKIESKKMGITINDFMLALTSTVIKKYFISKGDD